MVSRYSLLLVCLCTLLSFNNAVADSIDNLSERLIKLRSEVESLSEELVLLRQEHKQHMLGLVNQETELQSNIRSTQRKSKRLKKEIEKNKQIAGQAGVEDHALKPIVNSAIDSLEASIKSRVPFMIDERLKSLQDIKVNLEKGLVSSHKTARLLWSFFEDEISLTKENGLYKQEIKLGDDFVLADVAKIGMVGLFYRTAEDDYGMAVLDGDWRYKALESGADAEQIDYLFENFGRQIRSGYFEMPNFIARQVM